MRPRLSRRDAEAFAAAVDGRVQGRPGPVPTDRIRELVDVADLVRASSMPTARRDFVTGLRAELMSAAREELSAAAAPAPLDRLASPARLRRRLTAAASAFVVVGGTLGLVAASAQAMPGDMLYPVKRATEKVELMLRDGSAEGRVLLDHAQTRLGEVESLAANPGHDTEELISQTLADFTAEASTGGGLLLDSYRDGSSAAEIEALRTFTAESAQRLRDLAGSLPLSAANEYADATQAVSGLDASAIQVCPTCAADRPPVSGATDLVADVSRVLDSELAERPKPMGSRSDSTAPDATVGELPTGIDLPVIDPSDPLLGTDDGSGDDSPTDTESDPVEDAEDSTDEVDDGPTDLPTTDPTKPVRDLVKPLSEAVEGLLDDPLGTP